MIQDYDNQLPIFKVIIFISILQILQYFVQIYFQNKSKVYQQPSDNFFNTNIALRFIITQQSARWVFKSSIYMIIISTSVQICILIVYYKFLKLRKVNIDSSQMNTVHNSDIDHILVNLLSSSELKRPQWQQAIKYRQMQSVRSRPSIIQQQSQTGFFDGKSFRKYGTGVALYFNLLLILIVTFTILSINSIPSLICNFKGHGLDIFAFEGFSKNMMKLSVANQNHYDINQLELNSQALKDIEASQGILIVSDILATIIFICLLIYWQIKSDILIYEMISESVLPSSYTLIVSDYKSENFSQAQLKEYFQRYGNIAQIATVYNCGNFLIEVQQFMGYVDSYALAKGKEKETIFQELQQKYNRIKRYYINEQQTPVPVCSFITFDSILTKKNVRKLFKYIPLEHKFKDQVLTVKSCYVEPISIIWENFHIATKSEVYKGILITTLLISVFMVSLVGLFLLNAHATQLKQQPDVNIDPNKNYTYDEVLKTNSLDVLFNFCSKLNYSNFEWRYYVTCLPYFQSYQQKIFAMLTLSTLIVGINYVASRIIIALGDLRRYKTKTERSRFLIVNIFAVYFVSTALLVLLIKADFDGYSLQKLMQLILPEYMNSFNIEAYPDFNRKWYIHIGTQIIFNYAISMVISPFFQIILSWILMKYRFFMARRAKNQKQMNQTLVDYQFDFEYFYAMMLNSVFFCLFYANAIPILYTLAIFSLLALYISSVIVFKYFSCKPVAFDHSLNNVISKILTLGILMHQITSIFYYYTDDIFPINGNNKTTFFQKFHEGLIYIWFSLAIAIILYFHDQICKLAIKYWNKSYKDSHRLEHEKNKKKSFTEIFCKKNSTGQDFLASYKMEDNPFYNNLCYTISILELLSKKALINQEGSGQFQQHHNEYKTEINDHNGLLTKKSSKGVFKLPLTERQSRHESTKLQEDHEIQSNYTQN